MGDRASRWDRHHPRRLRAGRFAAARAARAGSGGDGAACADRRNDQPHRSPRGSWFRSTADRARDRRGSGSRGRLPHRTRHHLREAPHMTPVARLRSMLAAAWVFAMLVATPAFAAGSNMPWEQPLQQILQSIEGPVSKIIAVIIIIVTGLTLAFGDTAGGFRRLIQIVFGLSIAFAASSFFLSFFSFGGGALV